MNFNTPPTPEYIRDDNKLVELLKQDTVQVADIPRRFRNQPYKFNFKESVTAINSATYYFWYQCLREQQMPLESKPRSLVEQYGLDKHHITMLQAVHDGHQDGDELELDYLEQLGLIALDTDSDGVESFYCTGTGYEVYDEIQQLTISQQMPLDSE